MRRRETYLAVSGVVCLGSLELEGRPLIHGRSVVLAARHNTEGPAGLQVHGVDGPSLAGDVAVAGSGVGKEDMAVLLSTLTNHHHSGEKWKLYLSIISLSLLPLIVAGPGQVLDRSGDWLELVLQYVLLVDGVPDPHLPGLIRGGDIESTGTVLGHIDLEISVSQPASCE